MSSTTITSEFCIRHSKDCSGIQDTRSLGALWAPTSSLSRPLGLLTFSFAPFGYSGRATHAAVIVYLLEILFISDKKQYVRCPEIAQSSVYKKQQGLHPKTRYYCTISGGAQLSALSPIWIWGSKFWPTRRRAGQDLHSNTKNISHVWECAQPHYQECEDENI